MASAQNKKRSLQRINGWEFTFSFIMLIPLKEVDLDIDVASSSMVVQVYDPSPSRNYVQLHKKELIKTREALKDHSFAKNRAHKWSLIGDFFYKKANGWKPPHSPTSPGSPLTISFDNLVMSS